MFGFPILTCASSIILFFVRFTQETPKFFLQKQNPEKAREVFKTIYKEEYIDEQISIVQKDIKGSKGKNIKTIYLFTYLKVPFIIGCFLMLFKVLTGITVVIFSSNKIFQENGTSE